MIDEKIKKNPVAPRAYSPWVVSTVSPSSETDVCKKRAVRTTMITFSSHSSSHLRAIRYYIDLIDFCTSTDPQGSSLREHIYRERIAPDSCIAFGGEVSLRVSFVLSVVCSLLFSHASPVRAVLLASGLWWTVDSCCACRRLDGNEIISIETLELRTEQLSHLCARCAGVSTAHHRDTSHCTYACAKLLLNRQSAQITKPSMRKKYDAPFGLSTLVKPPFLAKLESFTSWASRKTYKRTAHRNFYSFPNQPVPSISP